MGSNHMNDLFRASKAREEAKRNIPTHDPQTGEANPYYEELTGEKLPEYERVIVPETDLEKLNRFLITVSMSEVGIRRKLLMLNKFIETLED